MEATQETPQADVSTLSAMECLREAWAGLKPKYWLFLGIVMVGMIVGGARVISAKGIAEFVTSFDLAEMQNTREITVGKGGVVGRKAVR